MASALEVRATARRELLRRRARVDLAAFTEYVFGYVLASHHRRWCGVLGESSRQVLIAPVEHAKSTLGSLALPLWILGRNPDARIALISETHSQAGRFLASIREHILRNERLHEVFPKLRPARGARERWTDFEILVERVSAAKDPSVLAVGVNGPLLGARLDLAILDDVCSFENTYTAAQREKVVAWFKSTVVGRIVSDGRIVVVGTPWHKDDLLHVLERSGEYSVIRDPATDASGEPLWPEAWPRARLEQRRREIGEVEFSRQMLLEVLSDAGSRFRQVWIERAFGLAAAVGHELCESNDMGFMAFTGVDLAVGATSQHDETVIFTIALLPDGRRTVLAVEAGRWQAPEILARIRSARTRFRSRVRVESNAGQMYLVQFLEGDGVHVEAHTTTSRNRHDPAFGIESLAVEFEQGRWIVPDAPETRAWARELTAFSPAGHPGDRVVASWLAREAARAFEEQPRVGLTAGASEFYENEEDDRFWVLGSARPPVPTVDAVTPPPVLGLGRVERPRVRPFIVR